MGYRCNLTISIKYSCKRLPGYIKSLRHYGREYTSQMTACLTIDIVGPGIRRAIGSSESVYWWTGDSELLGMARLQRWATCGAGGLHLAQASECELQVRPVGGGTVSGMVWCASTTVSRGEMHAKASYTRKLSYIDGEIHEGGAAYLTKRLMVDFSYSLGQFLKRLPPTPFADLDNKISISEGSNSLWNSGDTRCLNWDAAGTSLLNWDGDVYHSK